MKFSYLQVLVMVLMVYNSQSGDGEAYEYKQPIQGVSQNENGQSTPNFELERENRTGELHKQQDQVQNQEKSSFQGENFQPEDSTMNEGQLEHYHQHQVIQTQSSQSSQGRHEESAKQEDEGKNQSQQRQPDTIWDEQQKRMANFIQENENNTIYETDHRNKYNLFVRAQVTLRSIYIQNLDRKINYTTPILFLIHELKIRCFYPLILVILHEATPYLSTETLEYIQNYYISLLQAGIKKALIFALQLKRILTAQEVKNKPKKIYYAINYANLHGGAKIIMKSSSKIMSIHSILEDGGDKYMYTNQQLPLKIIIGLNEEIAIDSIAIKSEQMFSSITKDFKVEGKFSMADKKWAYLGTFKAEDIFGQQKFETERKIVRFIKITFLSAYGKWSYFTLTQVKIHGQNLFADAIKQSNSKKEHEEQSHRQQEDDHHTSICKNQFTPPSQQPHQNNLIASLISKINNLQLKNVVQTKELETVSSKLQNVYKNLEQKVHETKIYEKIIAQQKDFALKVVFFSCGLSIFTILLLFCLCYFRKKELENKKQE